MPQQAMAQNSQGYAATSRTQAKRGSWRTRKRPRGKPTAGISMARKAPAPCRLRCRRACRTIVRSATRSEEHTSELQSHSDLVCRLLLEKKKKKKYIN